MPLLMYRFRIIFPNQRKEDGDMITTNAVKLAINYTTSELHVTVRQDLHSATFHRIFSRMMKMINNASTGLQIAPIGSSQTILIEHMDGTSTKATAVLELDCSPKDHKFELNYENGGEVAEHQLVFTINNVTEYIEPAKQEKDDEVA